MNERYQYEVSGHSDDIIAIEGEEEREIYHYGDTTELLIGDTVLEVSYTVDGIWEIDITHMGYRDCAVKYGYYHPANKKNDYTQLVHVISDVKRLSEQ
jgi:hypothetical protein